MKWNIPLGFASALAFVLLGCGGGAEVPAADTAIVRGGDPGEHSESGPSGGGALPLGPRPAGPEDVAERVMFKPSGSSSVVIRCLVGRLDSDPGTEHTFHARLYRMENGSPGPVEVHWARAPSDEKVTFENLAKGLWFATVSDEVNGVRRWERSGLIELGPRTTRHVRLQLRRFILRGRAMDPFRNPLAGIDIEFVPTRMGQLAVFDREPVPMGEWGWDPGAQRITYPEPPPDRRAEIALVGDEPPRIEGVGSWSTATDSEGNFELYLPEACAGVLHASDPMQVRVPREAPVDRFTMSTFKEIEIRLRGRSDVAGWLDFPAIGDQIPDGTVVFVSQPGAARVASVSAEGHFSFEGIQSGPLEFITWRPDGQRGIHGHVVADLHAGRPLSVTIAGTAYPRPTVTGRVLGVDERPAPDVAVTFERDDPQDRHLEVPDRVAAETDDAGRFRVEDLEPGRWVLRWSDHEAVGEAVIEIGEGQEFAVGDLATVIAPE